MPDPSATLPPPTLAAPVDDSGDYLDAGAYLDHAHAGGSPAPAPAPAPARDPHRGAVLGSRDPSIGFVLDVPTGAGLGGAK